MKYSNKFFKIPVSYDILIGDKKGQRYDSWMKIDPDSITTYAPMVRQVNGINVECTELLISGRYMYAEMKVDEFEAKINDYVFKYGTFRESAGDMIKKVAKSVDDGGEWKGNS